MTFSGPSGAAIVSFTEDIAGAADTLVLRRNGAGQLEHSLNGGAFTNDLKSNNPSIQALAISAIARIDVALGGGNDVLSLDFVNGQMIPSAGGVNFLGGVGTDRISADRDADMTLSNTNLIFRSGGVVSGVVSLSNVETATLKGGNSPNLIDCTNFDKGPVFLDGGNQTDTLIGGWGDDVLISGNGGDLLFGGPGNDLLDGTNGGNVSLFGGDGDDTLVSGNGQDRLFGDAGNDTLLGGSSADQLFGGDGDDFLEGGPGNDSIDGGDGTDTVAATGDVHFTLTDNVLTGLGTDTLISIEAAQLTGGPTNKTIDASAFTGDTVLIGGGGDDTLIGGSGHNLFIKPVGELGNVTMIGGGVGSTNEYQLWTQGATRLFSLGGMDLINFNIATAEITFDLNIIDGTAQVVDAAGSTVALTGVFEELVGGDFDDTLHAASNSTVMGGDGEDTLVSTGKTGVTLMGGADADSLVQTGGTNIVMTGDSGLDTLTSTDGSNIIMNGGADADSLISINSTNITMNGGADADSLQQTGGAGIIMTGDSGLDTLVSINGTNITMNGGADADSLQQTGGAGIIMTGDSGLDTLVSVNGTNITMNGGADADSLQQTGGAGIIMTGDSGLDTLVSINGTNITMNGGADADSLISHSGSNITMNGGADADSLQQTGGSAIIMTGDSGLDTLISTDGANITMNGGADADSLQQSGGTGIIMTGDSGLDALTSTNGTSITMNGGADTDTLISKNGTEITMTGDSGDDSLVVSDSSDHLVSGGLGNDTYVISGDQHDNLVINEAMEPLTDTSVDTLDFSSFTGGGIVLDLALTGAQELVPDYLTLTLTDGMGIENVVGTGFADIIRGNDRDNQLFGADLPPPVLGVPAPWNGVTQVVFLDFDTYTDAGEHYYTQFSDPGPTGGVNNERDRIQQRLEADYIGPDPLNPWFHVQFVQTMPTTGPYATLYFNRSPIFDEDGTGGSANELDFRNLNLGTLENPSFATIQVNGILGAVNQPPDTSDNWVALSSKIAAHELGHLVGLLHEDSFGPIGYGPHSPPGGISYNPDFPGPAAGFETFDHLSSSPASVGSNRFNDLRDLFFGEREAIKLAFAQSGTVINEQAAAHGSLAASQPIVLNALTVPNMMSSGLNSMKQFAVDAINVLGSIQTDLSTGLSESDFFSFTGRKGDLLNIRLYSLSLTRLGANVFDGMLRVFDSAGSLVAYYGGAAFNDDNFESTDAGLIDLFLPADGTYYIEVDTFHDTATGQYELFVNRFDAWNANDVGDVLEGRGGNNLLKGGIGDDSFVMTTGPTAGSSVDGGSGNDVLDFSAITADLAWNIAGNNTGSVGGMLFASVENLTSGSGADVFLFSPAAGVTGAIQGGAGADIANYVAYAMSVSVNLTTGSATGAGSISGIEHVFGGSAADSLIGNAADNILIGNGGNDSINGNDGRDILIGGAGADLLDGGVGDDILIGGTTSHDNLKPNLLALMAEWSRTDLSVAARIDHLTGAVGGGLNGIYLLNSATLFDDNQSLDSLFGRGGADWFVLGRRDRAEDREPLDTVTRL